MNTWIRVITPLLACCLLAPSQSSSPASGVDLKAIDKSVDPCQNFFEYACGTWMKNNPIPPQYSTWGRFNQLADHNQQILREILEDAAQHQARSALDAKIGAMYSSCMDEAAVEKAGATPIKPELEKIQSLAGKSGLPALVAALHAQGVGVFFTFHAGPDPDKSTVNIANVDQGGLGLPDKSYYLDPKDEELRSKYLQHISKMLQLVGYPADQADTKAKGILALETSLAQVSLDRVARRNPDLTHHKMPATAFEASVPAFDFKEYLEALNAA